MKSWIKRVLIYIGVSLFSMILVYSTSFEGERIETREELESAFPIKTGFPLRFAELKYPEIDPPLPWDYNGSCCYHEITSWPNYWISVLIVFVFLLLFTEVVRYLIRRYSQ